MVGMATTSTALATATRLPFLPPPCSLLGSQYWQVFWHGLKKTT